MTRQEYKGYHIDGVLFHDEADVDNFIKRTRILSLQLAIMRFFSELDYNASERVLELEHELMGEYGLTWHEVEDIEINAMNEVM